MKKQDNVKRENVQAAIAEIRKGQGWLHELMYGESQQQTKNYDRLEQRIGVLINGGNEQVNRITKTESQIGALIECVKQDVQFDIAIHANIKSRLTMLESATEKLAGYAESQAKDNFKLFIILAIVSVLGVVELVLRLLGKG